MAQQGSKRRTRTATAVFTAGLAAILGMWCAAASAASWPPGMREGDQVKGPKGFYALCDRAPTDCPTPRGALEGGPVRAHLTPDQRRGLDRMNLAVNHEIAPMSDREQYGVSDYWTRPTGALGDCEDYALAKRAELIAQGWPEAALLIAVVRGVETPYHAVLIARTDQGELVLDNLRDDVLDWRDTGYVWVVRQSQNDPSRWVRVIGLPAEPRAARGETRPSLLSGVAENGRRPLQTNAQY